MTKGRIRAVVFDSGETLIDETRAWAEWADWLGVRRFTFMAILGGLIARGEHHRRVFEMVRPGFDFDEAVRERERAGNPYRHDAQDVYPDVRPCLRALTSEGYVLGIAGNYGTESEAFLPDLGLPVDFVASSERWGAEKPSEAFFRHLVETAGFGPREIAYVGDRLDNDVVGAADAGLYAVWLVRGPWAILHSNASEARRADLRVHSLDEIAPALGRLSH